MESNDSPEIPDGGRHQIFPASLRGICKSIKLGLSLCSNVVVSYTRFSCCIQRLREESFTLENNNKQNEAKRRRERKRKEKETERKGKR